MDSDCVADFDKGADIRMQGYFEADDTKSSAEEWDDSLVLIFPITPDMLEERTSKDYMTAVGNWMIDNHVPMMDYFNHNYHI